MKATNVGSGSVPQQQPSVSVAPAEKPQKTTDLETTQAQTVTPSK